MWLFSPVSVLLFSATAPLAISLGEYGAVIVRSFSMEKSFTSGVGPYPYKNRGTIFLHLSHTKIPRPGAIPRVVFARFNTSSGQESHAMNETLGSCSCDCGDAFHISKYSMGAVYELPEIFLDASAQIWRKRIRNPSTVALKILISNPCLGSRAPRSLLCHFRLMLSLAVFLPALIKFTPEHFAGIWSSGWKRVRANQ